MPQPTRAHRLANPKRSQTVTNIGGRTKQSFTFDADPNTLMRQFTKTGDTDILKRTTAIAMQGDFSAVPDFFTALLQVQQVQEDFLALPSKARNHFDNDASLMIDALADPSRAQELVDLGLVDGTSTTKPPPSSNRPAPELGAETPGEIIEETSETSSS